MEEDGLTRENVMKDTVPFATRKTMMDGRRK
jgi:hypothetical protein